MNKNFYLLLVGRVVSVFGDHLNNIAIMWLVLDISNSYVMSSLSLVASFLPGILFASFFGFITDRFNPKWLLILSDFCNAILTITLALLIFIFDLNSVYVIFIIAFIMSCFDCLYSVSCMSTIKNIVTEDKMQKSNATLAMYSKISSLVGTLAAGTLYSLIGVGLLFLINGISFLISAISELFIKFDFVSNIKDRVKFSFNKDVLEILKKIKENKALFFYTVTGCTIINTLLSPTMIYIQYFTRNNSSKGAFTYSVASTFIIIGNICMAFIISKGKKQFNYKATLSLAFILQGLLLMALAIVTDMIVFYFVMFLLGMAVSLVSISLGTLIQKSIAADIIGRSGGVFMTISNIITPLGFIIGGIAIENLDYAIVVGVSGALITIISLYSIRYIKY